MALTDLVTPPQPLQEPTLPPSNANTPEAPKPPAHGPPAGANPKPQSSPRILFPPAESGSIRHAAHSPLRQVRRPLKSCQHADVSAQWRTNCGGSASPRSVSAVSTPNCPA